MAERAAASPSGTAPSGRQFTIRHGATEATVVEVGGGLRTFTIEGRDVLEGYGVDDMASAGRGQVLIPWPNRIDGGRYEWNGQTRQLPLNELDKSTAIHGLVRWQAWECVEHGEGFVRVAHTLWPSPGYPFMIEIEITYRVGDRSLTVLTTARNTGAAAAPFGAGQHPYLLPPLGLPLDDCVLSLPATTYLETDQRGLPVATHSVADSPFDFRTGRTIAGSVLDTPIGSLERDRDGRAMARLASPDGSAAVELWVSEGYRYLQVFSGDTLPPDRRRRALAIEPMTCPPNAFAAGTDVTTLRPGEEMHLKWGLTVPTDR